MSVELTIIANCIPANEAWNSQLVDIVFHNKKLKNKHPKSFKGQLDRSVFIKMNNGTKPIKIRQVRPYVGHDKPRNSPDRTLNNKYFNDFKFLIFKFTNH